jgi:hypothetical protein
VGENAILFSGEAGSARRPFLGFLPRKARFFVPQQTIRTLILRDMASLVILNVEKTLLYDFCVTFYTLNA